MHRVTHAAVAANTSLLVAVVKIDTATENSRVNVAIRNKRPVIVCTQYKTAMEATGKSEAMAVVHVEVKYTKCVSRITATSHFL